VSVRRAVARECAEYTTENEIEAPASEALRSLARTARSYPPSCAWHADRHWEQAVTHRLSPGFECGAARKWPFRQRTGTCIVISVGGS